ncbi:nitrous oxide reductase accessory protein NosL [Dyella sp. KRB-257]|uniref:nitrous oxide reductase accessory protein NosL n=1 Tax=Dyella sp. KRB-257 TaxID=3400915 RepID=UPI003BFF06F7
MVSFLHNFWRTAPRVLGTVMLLALLAACGDSPGVAQHAVDTHDDDVCAVCGMYLKGSPGPRAEAWLAGRARPLIFDSTRDFFAYVLQPENQARLRGLFVQDSARIDWQHPSHAAASFIDARSAAYVAWQPLPGSMGPTLAPFATPAAAAAFVQAHGGQVLRFDQVTTDLVSSLDYRCPVRVAAAEAAGGRCMAVGDAARALPPHMGGPPAGAGMIMDAAARRAVGGVHR